VRISDPPAGEEQQRSLANERLSPQPVSLCRTNRAAAIFRELISAPASSGAIEASLASPSLVTLRLSHIYSRGGRKGDEGANTCRDGHFGRSDISCANFRPISSRNVERAKNSNTAGTTGESRRVPAPAVNPLCWQSGDFRVGRKFRGRPERFNRR